MIIFSSPGSPRVGARESAETHTHAAHRGGAPRLCVRRAAHTRGARKAHASSGRTRGRSLGDGARCHKRSGGGARAWRHRGVCREMGPHAARAVRGLVCPLQASGFRSLCCYARPPALARAVPSRGFSSPAPTGRFSEPAPPSDAPLPPAWEEMTPTVNSHSTGLAEAPPTNGELRRHAWWHPGAGPRPRRGALGGGWSGG